MEYRLGNAKKVISKGETEEITCPICNKKVNMGVFSNGDFRLEAKMPLLKVSKVFFLVCPACTSVFGVDESKGKVFEKGEKLDIGNFDLKELEVFEV